MRYEISQGNGATARATLKELDRVPIDLEDEVRRLEAMAASQKAQELRIRHLSKEFDPRVSQRQRVLFVVLLGVTTIILVELRNVEWAGAVLRASGAWYMVGLMAAAFAVYLVGLRVGQRSLLATRVNRRIAGLLGTIIVATIVNRLLALVNGLSVPDAGHRHGHHGCGLRRGRLHAPPRPDGPDAGVRGRRARRARCGPTTSRPSSAWPRFSRWG